jgi:predicted NBD/HSP70 family sugar kinase
MKDEKQARLLAGLDIGGTKTAVLLVDQARHVLARETLPTLVSDDPALLVRGIAAAVRAALGKAGARDADLLAVGAGVPGMVEGETGMVRLAVNLGLESYPLGAALAAELAVPVALENDVRAAALGAFAWLGRREDVRSIAYLSLGTGISAGLILDGRLYRGGRGMAGEIGHVIMEPDGARCKCGLRGCLETVASGPAIGSAWAAGDGTAPVVFAAAEAGDETAVAVIQRAAEYTARAIQLLVMTVDVDKVAVGGGVAQAGAAFTKRLETELARLRDASELARVMLPANIMEVMPAEADVARWGAVALAEKLL